MNLKKLSLYCIWSCLLAILPLNSQANRVVRDELEPLIVGKAGLGYLERSLYRGSGDIEVVRIEDKFLHRWFVVPKSDAKGPKLVPNFSGTKEIMQLYHSYRSEELIELLYQMPLPESLENNNLRLSILQKLSDWESMEGIQYFSTSIQKMTTYIKRVEVVDKVGSYSQRQFSLPLQLPNKPLKFIILQADNKFAPCWYEFNLSTVGSDALRIEFTNRTDLQVPLLFFRFKALAAGDMLHNVYLIVRKDKLEIYILSQIRNAIKEILGRKLDLSNSFDRRMSSIQGWINSRLY